MCIELQGPAIAKPVFRSLKELNRDFQQRQTCVTHDFRSLEELTQDFQRRQLVANQHFRSLNQLKCDFQQRHVIANRDFRSLAQLSQEFQKRQAANVDACRAVLDSESSCSQNVMVNSVHVLFGPAGTVQSIQVHIHQPPASRCCKAELNPAACYSRAELLSVFGALRAAGGRAPPVPRPVIRTVHMPCTTTKARKNTCVNVYKASCLDDEKLVATMEARLSWESGADAKNVETFGESEGGWSFDDFVAANAKLLLCHPPVKGNLDNSTAASDGTSSERGSLEGDCSEPVEEFLFPLSFLAKDPM